MKTSKNFPFLFLLLISSTNLFSQGDPKLTEVWEPVPAIIAPGTAVSAPSDAIVLFDGKNLDQWQNSDGGQAGWDVKDGVLTVKPGAGIIKTKSLFGDCQLHIEWRAPVKVSGEGQGRGNSGIFLQDRYELQVLDCYNNITYSNGQTGSIYKQGIPLVNACLKPGEWQTYDVIYKAPVFKQDGSPETPAYITVLHNGVLIQNHFEIKGSTEYIGQPQYKAHQKDVLTLQDHGNDVSYRNIWIRNL